MANNLDSSVLTAQLNSSRGIFFNSKVIKMADGSFWSAQDFVTHYLSGTSGAPVNGREQRTPVTVDTDWFMSQGPGKNVSLASFTEVQGLYYSGAAQLADGVYSITNFLSPAQRLGYLKNYTTNVDVNDPSYLAYSYVFGTSAFRLTDAKVYVQNGQVTNITDPKITPLWDNFDFDTPGRDIVDKFIINPLKAREANLVDPGEHGQQFDIRFSSAAAASGSNTGGSPLWTQQQLNGTGNQPFVLGASAVDFAALFGHPFNGSAQDIISLLSGIGNGQVSFSGSYVPESDPNQYLTSSYSVQGGEKVFVSQQSAGWFASMVRNGEIDRTVLNRNDGSRVDSQYQLDGRLRTQEDVFTNGTSAIKYLDPKNTHPYNKIEVVKGATGQVTSTQISLDQAVAAAGTVGQVLGSAIGAALGGNDLAGRVVAGAVAGLIGQKLAQTFAASLAIDASSQVIGNFATVSGLDIAHVGIGAISSFITAELGSALHISGFGEHLFNGAANGFTISVLEQVRAQITAGASFDAAIGAIDWGGAVTGAVNGVNINLAGMLGAYLGRELVEAKTHEGAVGGQLMGAVGSAIGTLIGGIGNFILPGIGALIGTILGTWIGNHFGTQPSPSAVDLIDQAGDRYGFGHYQSADGGGYDAPDQMAAAAVAIVNTYLTAVNGAAFDHYRQATVGYSKNPDVLYVSGVPGHTDRSFTDVNDSVHAVALDVLQHTEVIGGDLLLKRAHQNSPSNIPETQAGGGAPGQSQISGAAQLVTMSADLRVAQDYENYLNNREAINALMAAYPESAFTAGWIATFARVNDLGLNHMSASDFLGGLVGWLDSVSKAGLGAAAANATVSRGVGNTVVVEIKIPNGAEVPGALSVFADHMTVSSDASGQTLQFIVDSGFSASGTQYIGGGASGAAGHDILVGSAADDSIGGGQGWDFIDGGAGSDHLYGEDGSDILRGGLGNDDLQGGLGNDTYVFNRGDGADMVLDDYTVTTDTSHWNDEWRDEDGDGTNELHHDWIPETTTDHPNAGTDSLVFGPGISRADIVAHRSGNDLIVGVKDPAHPGALTDQITLQRWFDADGFDRIELFRFADGSTLDLSAGQAAIDARQVPFGAALSCSGVVERSAIGTEVGTVTGFDFNPDAGLSYWLVNPDGRFAINASTGVLTVAGSIDYDAGHSAQVEVRVIDQSGYWVNQAFTINVIDLPNRAPVLSVPATVTASAGQSLQASSLFSAVDADGDALTYFFQDGTSAANSGRFVLNGTAMAQGAGFNVSAAQLAQLTFVAGSVDDNLSMQLADSHDALSAAAGVQVHVNRAPVLSVPASTVTANANQSLQVSGLFSAVDAEGDPLTYFFQDGTSAANSGRFVLNGTPYAQGAAFNVSAAQLAQLTFVAGGVDDNLSMQLADDAEAHWGHRSLNRNRRAMARSRVRGSGWRHARGAGASFACVHKRFA